MTLVTTIAPTVEPVSVSDIKLQLRVDDDAEEDLIDSLIQTARVWVEEYTGVRLMSQTVTLYIDDAFPLSRFRLRVSPVQSISSVKYYDDDDVLQTLASNTYRFGNAIVPRIEPVDSWPSAKCRLDAVQIEMVVGYTTSAAIPDQFKQAIKLIVGDLWLNREASQEGMLIEPRYSVRNLLGPFRMSYL